MWFLLQPSEALHWKETKTPAVPLFFQMFPLHLRFRVFISESSKHLIPVASLSYRKIALKEIIRPTRINRSLLVSKAYLFQDFILLKIYYQLLGSLIIISPIWFIKHLIIMLYYQPLSCIFHSTLNISKC